VEANPIAANAYRTQKEYSQRRERLAKRALARSRKAERMRLGEALGLPHASDAEALLALGITAENAAAFEALPLVEVAWADGRIDEEERWRLLEVATRLGVEFGRPAHALLESWLERRPAPQLFGAWLMVSRADRPRAIGRS